VIRRLKLFMGAALVFWVVLSYPTLRLGGSEALAYSAVAAGLCLVPTVVSMILAEWAVGRAPGNALWMLLGGTGIRMAVVLGVGLVVSARAVPGIPEINVGAFWLWILVFYLFTLALEVTLLTGRTQIKPARTEHS
jgi:hypothetical protein